ncbi:MAG: zf-TFIIB domain-containing protein [Verrucomicrobiota bacterium]
MNCPRCGSSMEKAQTGNEQIDRCTKCGGLWFGELELEDLRAQKESERIDTGKPNPALDPNARLKCPKCETPMTRMVDNEHPHIWYETCGVCGGSFLDAGEFKEMKRHNLVEKIKDLMAELKGGRSPVAKKLSSADLRKILQ